MKRSRVEDAPSGKENNSRNTRGGGAITQPGRVPLETRSPLKKKQKQHERTEQSKEMWTIDKFQLKEENLGKGMFGQVRLYADKETKKLVAIKEVPLCNEYGALLKRELENHYTLTCCKHPNIIKLHGYFCVENLGLYMVMDYAENGNVYDWLSQDGEPQPLDEATAARFVLQTSRALHCCHHYEISHRDLKPENLLLDANWNIQLTDFGWSVHGPGPHKEKCGTLDYLPPEMLAADRGYNSKLVDIWALGVLAYEFLYATPPFLAPTQEETEERILNVDFQFPDEPAVSEGAKDLIRKLLVHRPEDRLTLAEIWAHPWISSQLGPQPAVSSDNLPADPRRLQPVQQHRRRRSRPAHAQEAGTAPMRVRKAAPQPHHPPGQPGEHSNGGSRQPWK